MSVTLRIPSLASIAAVLATLAGMSGVVLTAAGVGNLAPSVNEILLGLSGLLVLVSHWHVAKIVAARKAPPVG